VRFDGGLIVCRLCGTVYSLTRQQAFDWLHPAAAKRA
jgi:hypothetical protein